MPSADAFGVRSHAVLVFVLAGVGACGNELPPIADDTAVAPAGDAAPDACQPGDVHEIAGTKTSFTQAACGELSSNGDVDFFSFTTTQARTLTIRFAGESDAVAHVSNPNGRDADVDSGGPVVIEGTPRSLAIRVGSARGAVQKYRIVVE